MAAAKAVLTTSAISVPVNAVGITAIVGAGISVPEPTGAPDFQGLRDRFLALADPELDPEPFQLDELSPEQVFDAIDDGREKLRQAVRRELWWLCEPGEPNANHYAVAALIAAGVTVWTSNFDTMVERAAQRLGTPVEPVIPGQPGDLLAIDSAEPLLFKPHGSFPYSGDPPREPRLHRYRLLFQSSEVWLMNETWAERLRADLRGRDVFIFGYRGADPDLTPIMLRAFEEARSISWWEFETARNFERLQRLLANSLATVVPGNPSAALQDFAQQVAPHTVPEPRGEALAPPERPPIKLSHVSRARLLGQFRGAGVARWILARAVLFDPPENRGIAAFRLARSLGYDIAWLREPLVAVFGLALRLPHLRRSARLNELYVTWVDSRPIGRRDRRAVDRALRAPGGERAETLVRAASTKKLLGDLDAALDHANEALAELRSRPTADPLLEAMTVYNLAWIYRQRGEFGQRAALVEGYSDRLPHIGFNWAAWLGLDDVLVALHFGEVVRARQLMNSPVLSYARSLTRHPMYQLDDQLTETLVSWHEHGPGEVGDELRDIVAEYGPVRPILRPPFSVLNALILLGDHARAVGDHAGMSAHLRLARRRTSSAIQQAEIELVEAVASDDDDRLRRLRDAAERRRFGLITMTLDAVHAHRQGRSQDSAIFYAPHLPLAGCY